MSKSDQEVDTVLQEVENLENKHAEELASLIMQHDLHKGGGNVVYKMIREYLNLMGEKAYNILKEDAVNRFGHSADAEALPDPTSYKN